MPAGEAFSARQREDITRAIAQAKQACGVRFSVYVGPAEGDSRGFARRLHAALGPDASHAVLVFVDPANRRLEVVTGPEARRQLDDRSCALAGMSMTTAFVSGDLAGGIVNGLRMLAEHARRPRSLHGEQY